MLLSNDNTYQKQDPEKGIEKRVAYLIIAGMGCSNCAARIQSALMSIQGVSEVIVDHREGFGQVTYNPQLVSDMLFVQTVKSAGNDGHHRYDAQLIELEGLKFLLSQGFLPNL